MAEAQRRSVAETRLAATTIVLRAREHWQALDLGVALVREHWRMLYGGWLVVTLPIAVLVTWLLPAHPVIATALFWWLKPLYERLPLLFLSRVVFGERLSPGALARAYVRLLGVQPLATLLWRRASMTRSVDQAVTLLEGARGTRRRERLRVLHRGAGTHAVSLTVMMFVFELALTVGNNVFANMFLPDTWDDGDFAVFTQQSLGLLPYFVGVWLVGPLFAACGFSLYINRRCELEGWDIEVGFRRLASRLLASALLLGCFFGVALALPMPAQAALSSATSSARPTTSASPSDSASMMPTAQSKGLPAVAPASAAAQSHRAIETVLAGADFHHADATRFPAFLEDMFPAPQREKTFALPAWLGSAMKIFIDGLWWLAWAVVVAVLVWLGYRYRYWLAALLGRTSATPAGGDAPAMVVAGVRLTAADVAGDSISAARALWAGDELRAAVAMLFRLTLVALVQRYGCVFRHGDTEGDCTRRVAASQASDRASYFTRLVAVWQEIAYAHRAPNADTFADLLHEYGRVIAPGS